MGVYVDTYICHYYTTAFEQSSLKICFFEIQNTKQNVGDSPSKRPRTTELKRRNSTGTIFLSNTMSFQDNAATIECVCVVIRTHMLDAAKENVVPLPEYDVFKDSNFQKKDGKSSDHSNVSKQRTRERISLSLYIYVLTFVFIMNFE